VSNDDLEAPISLSGARQRRVVGRHRAALVLRGQRHRIRSSLWPFQGGEKPSTLRGPRRCHYSALTAARNWLVYKTQYSDVFRLEGVCEHVRRR
jgi:hypothetical protein